MAADIVVPILRFAIGSAGRRVDRLGAQACASEFYQGAASTEAELSVRN